MELPQLYQIKAHLDLILLALEALTEISSETMLQAAVELKLHNILSDRLVLWRLRQANPFRKGSSGKTTSGRKKLDVDEAKAIALITSHIASKEQRTIREAVAELEKCTLKKASPHQQRILGDYLDRFYSLYEERMAEATSNQNLENLALKLLIDLLFYSSVTGSRRLWMSLLEMSLVESKNSLN
ncbi:Protein of unknown function (DUF3038) [Synechococcus sp. PCC 7502]|uniref:DUF3038 domain-containing protein n=1 Tax=Synechococcus sp. PCC 7502 TaxID=1173263 RepID=UPI00029FF15D|nr:DUF3038 domain-containing protein [Synechococcus sp. PCC 7502]AFY72770.1 Protein of unknown function (DUF3038) [Synechococcus sp. PCC 7502]